MKIDLKLVFLVLVVLCLVGEINGWGSGRSRSRSGSRSRSVSRSSYRRSGSRVRRSGYRRSTSRVRRSYRRVRRARRYRRVRRVRRYRRVRRVRRYRRVRRWRRYRRVRKVRRYRRIRRIRKIQRKRKGWLSRTGRKIKGWFSKSGRKVKGWFSKSGRKIKATPPHSIKTKSGLTRLYNSKVVKVERVKRPLNGFLGKLGVPHSGVVVTTASGKRYLVHKGPGYGKSSQTVVTDAKNMSKKWKVEKSKKVTGARVGDYVKTGGKTYRVFTDNCNQASQRMYNKIKG
ncbi:uncharacterized protein LOC116304407 isoform X3 [Actinia tenebrosa]|uniref:Uncharacterized protein LOC116304407 isoform X2 n=1 Tax=Actinia tenebrosa TaxID=6105 RepID=A0A6P8ISV6_ACTTE|nr:uncharacterized protein LOC116304407 isoform X2 [Actinia tenebrosa]XP_031569998.1 uncharacterized protein LOC116304407 isoform X3 [Actinia tenebrosa]